MNTANKSLDINGPCREKVWPERNDQEKLEALRIQVIHLATLVQHQACVHARGFVPRYAKEPQALSQMRADQARL